MFKDFADLKIKEMVSNNDRKNWSKFEVSKDSGYQMIITQNGKDNTFLVGKAGSLVNDFYIRKEGIKNVYLANGELKTKWLGKMKNGEKQRKIKK